MGSTGDTPVPSRHWPDGMGKMLSLQTDTQNSSGVLPVSHGGGCDPNWLSIQFGAIPPVENRRYDHTVPVKVHRQF